jgi:hypothetical protein
VNHHQRDRPLAKVLVSDAGTVDRLRPSGLGDHPAMVIPSVRVMQHRSDQGFQISGLHHSVQHHMPARLEPDEDLQATVRSLARGQLRSDNDGTDCFQVLLRIALDRGVAGQMALRVARE